MNKKSTIATLTIIAAGIVLGLLIVLSGDPSKKMDEHGRDAKDERRTEVKTRGGNTRADGPESAKGQHGGRLLSQGNFAIEVTIFEQGVPPEFRAYPYENGKAANASDAKLSIIINRLGSSPETIQFAAQQNFLRGDREIIEPHSFTVQVIAEYKGQSYRWAYEQLEGRVRMDDATAKTTGITIEAAGPSRIRSTLQMQGEIQFNQDRLVRVAPRLAGVVTNAAKNLGDAVKRGDVLAVVESQELGNLKSDYLAAQQRLAMARTTFEREKKLWEEKISAEQDYLASRQMLAEAEITQRNTEQKLTGLGFSRTTLQRPDIGALTRLEVRAPIDGVVIEKRVATGEAVAAEANIYVIADLSTVWAEVTIYPKDLNAVKLTQKVTVRASALDTEATGTISYVGALLGEQTRTAKARITLLNPDQRWRPGLFVTVDVVQNEAEVAVAVPLEAIQTLRDWKVVFVRFGDAFEARPVKLGRSDGKRVEIIGGLAAGVRYAAANSFVLKADLGKAGASHDH